MYQPLESSPYASVLSPATVELLRKRGAAFLSEQGNTVIRGYIDKIGVGADCWEVKARDIEVYDTLERDWKPSEPSETLSSRGNHARLVFEDDDHLIELGGYGFAVYVSTLREQAFSRTDWPELDVYPGGRMTS